MEKRGGKIAVSHNQSYVNQENKMKKTEEWIEEKATEFMLNCPGIIARHYESMEKFTKDFIRSLVEEIHGRK